MAGTRTRISEYREHPMAGSPPQGYNTWREFAESIPPYSIVDTDMLYQGDSDPFHLTLDILKLDAVSANGLLYDETLVSEIERQLPGKGGIRGHIPAEDEGYSFPYDEVDWIGHVRVGDTTYAKAYIPPGQTREMVRRIMARGGQLRTSFAGTGIPEDVDAKRGTWRLTEFELDQLDLAPANKAALRRNQSGAPIVTRQMLTKPDTEGIPMSDKPEITLNDVPEAIREQIVTEAKLKLDAGRVTELEQKLAAAEQKVTEMRQQTEIVGEIRTLIGGDNTVDLLGVIRQMQGTLSGLANTLGVDAAMVETRVSELYINVQQMRQTEFARRVSDAVAEFTNWQTRTPEQAKKVAQLRQTMQRMLETQVKVDDTAETIKESAQAIWDNELSEIGAAVRQALVGPAAIVGGKSTQGKPLTAQEIEEARAKTGI